MKLQNLINHVVLVLDGSLSMEPNKENLIRVADDQVKYLATRSQEMDQETRITIYSFNDTVQCLVYDKDVLRLPSVRSLYDVGGWTALIDATLLSLDDLAMTPEKYGDHSFLVFVLTDGAENRSKRRAYELTTRLNSLPDNWTVAALVPDQRGVFEAKHFGFPAANISVWDATSSSGVSEAGSKIREATDSYMTMRSTGVRGSKSLFDTSVQALNKQTVSAAPLVALNASEYLLVPVIKDCVIKDFVEQDCGKKWQVGRYMYELMKKEKIQGNKLVAVLEVATSKVFTGQAARDLIGLPDMNVEVKPNANPAYKVFVQSTSNNRKLIAGTKFMILT